MRPLRESRIRAVRGALEDLRAGVVALDERHTTHALSVLKERRGLWIWGKPQAGKTEFAVAVSDRLGALEGAYYDRAGDLEVVPPNMLSALDDPNRLFIFDDMHREPDMSGELVDLAQCTRYSKALFLSRSKPPLEVDSIDVLEIQPTAEQIVDLDKRLCAASTVTRSSVLDHKLAEIMLEQSGGDLWVIREALVRWNGVEDPVLAVRSDSVLSRFRENYLSPKNAEEEQIAKSLLTGAILYQLEIAVPTGLLSVWCVERLKEDALATETEKGLEILGHPKRASLLVLSARRAGWNVGAMEASIFMDYIASGLGQPHTLLTALEAHSRSEVIKSLVETQKVIDQLVNAWSVASTNFHALSLGLRALEDKQELGNVILQRVLTEVGKRAHEYLLRTPAGSAVNLLRTMAMWRSTAIDSLLDDQHISQLVREWSKSGWRSVVKALMAIKSIRPNLMPYAVGTWILPPPDEMALELAGRTPRGLSKSLNEVLPLLAGSHPEYGATLLSCLGAETLARMADANKAKFFKLLFFVMKIDKATGGRMVAEILERGGRKIVDEAVQKGIRPFSDVTALLKPEEKRRVIASVNNAEFIRMFKESTPAQDRGFALGMRGLRNEDRRRLAQNLMLALQSADCEKLKNAVDENESLWTLLLLAPDVAREYLRNRTLLFKTYLGTGDLSLRFWLLWNSSQADVHVSRDLERTILDSPGDVLELCTGTDPPLDDALRVALVGIRLWLGRPLGVLDHTKINWVHLLQWTHKPGRLSPTMIAFIAYALAQLRRKKGMSMSVRDCASKIYWPDLTELKYERVLRVMPFRARQWIDKVYGTSLNTLGIRLHDRQL